MYRLVVKLISRPWLLIAFVILIASACAGGAGSPGELLGKQSSTAAATRSTREDIPAGEYTTKNFEPTLSFTLGEGWQLVIPDQRHVVDIERGIASGIDFMNVRYVYDANNPLHSGSNPAPSDMVAWLEQHPYLDAEKPQPVAIGGVEGKQFDVSAPKMPEESPPGCGGPCVPLFELAPGLSFAMAEGEKERFIVLEGVEGKTVTIAAGAPVEEFEAFIPKAQKVLKSVEWEDA